MKRAFAAGCFFSVVSAGTVFVALLFLVGSGFRILSLCALLAGFLVGFAAFLFQSHRFPVLGGMFSGSVALLALPYVSYALAFLLASDLPLGAVPRIALLNSVTYLAVHGSSLVVVGAVLGGGFIRFRLIRERRDQS